MAQHLRLSRQNQERVGASRHVFCIQISRCLPMQGTPKTEKETDGKYFLCLFLTCSLADKELLFNLF